MRLTKTLFRKLKAFAHIQTNLLSVGISVTTVILLCAGVMTIDSYADVQYDTGVQQAVVLLIDCSNSMIGKSMEETKQAAIAFTESIMREEQALAVIAYSTDAETISGFSDDMVQLTECINAIEAGGKTNMYEGLSTAFELLRCSGAERKTIVMMSDGKPNLGLVGEKLTSYTDEIKKDNVTIYTIGFFKSLSQKETISAQELLELIASDGCHYEVGDVDSLKFVFSDVADVMNGGRYIYISVACPVDVSVSVSGETLCRENQRTNFGTLSFEKSEEGDVKILRLKEGTDYPLRITGTGNGTMNCTIAFMDEEGSYSDMRNFKNIPVTPSTTVDTLVSVGKRSSLHVDSDGDGEYDKVIIYKGNTETSENYMCVVCAVLFLTAAVTTGICLSKKHGNGIGRGV